MNKSAGGLLAVVVAIGAISAGGAWYTGTKLEGVLQTSIADANKELQTAMVGSNTSFTLKLVSLDIRLFSSTAHYSVKGQSKMFGDEPIELLFAEHFEHGPLPFSRLMSFKWLPVMASSHYSLEKNLSTEKWFAATKGESPLKGMVNIGYDRAISGNLELLPIDTALDDKSTLKFSGLNLNMSTTAQAQKIYSDGYMGSLTLTSIAEDQPSVEIELNGLTLVSNLSKSSYGYYLGEQVVELASSKTTFGDKQSVLAFKNAEMKSTTTESGTNAAGRFDYKISEIAFNDKTLGSAQMAWSMKNIDIPSTLSLVQIYKSKLQPYEAAVAAGESAPNLNLSDAEQAQVKAILETALAAKPQFALENLSFITPNGESHTSLVIDLSKTQSLDLPYDQLGKQMIAQLDFNLQLSKPMITDLLSLQAQMDGQTDAKAIADQATTTSEMVSDMIVATHLATLDGNNIVSKLHYTNNQVDFNGKKMTVEQFVNFVLGNAGNLGDLADADEAQ